MRACDLIDEEDAVDASGLLCAPKIRPRSPPGKGLPASLSGWLALDVYRPRRQPRSTFGSLLLDERGGKRRRNQRAAPWTCRRYPPHPVQLSRQKLGSSNMHTILWPSTDSNPVLQCDGQHRI